MREPGDGELDDLLGALYSRYQEDFRAYARSSIRRRVASALSRFGCATAGELRDRVLADGVAFRELLGFLTVQVSDMFRDPPFFQAVRREVIPVLATYPSIRVWVAGCASGEEAYALAIVLREEGLLERALLYATDVEPAALERAQAGIYPASRVAAFSRA